MPSATLHKMWVELAYHDVDKKKIKK